MPRTNAALPSGGKSNLLNMILCLLIFISIEFGENTGANQKFLTAWFQRKHDLQSKKGGEGVSSGGGEDKAYINLPSVLVTFKKCSSIC